MSDLEIKVPVAPILEKGGTDEKAKLMRQQISASKDCPVRKNTVYYISNNGDDKNDGLTPQTPFKTVERAEQIRDFSYTLLFERGSIFRLNHNFIAYGQTAYGAYGEGEKPKFYGSERDYADSSLWSLKENDIWELYLDTADAGMINFNNDTYIGDKKAEYSEIENDGDFYHDNDNKKLYLKLSSGNPGEVFGNIEIATTKVMFMIRNANNIQFDNLCIKYATVMGISAADCGNIQVTNCEFGWIGGHWASHKPNRYGNAVELYYRASECCVKNCWFYQIFDAAVTFQGEGPGEANFKSIYFEDNLIEHSSMNFEYWPRYIDKNGVKHENGKVYDIRFCGNLLRGAGYGWSGKQRITKANQSFLLSWDRVFGPDSVKAFYITDNIFDCADCPYIYAGLPSEQDGLHVKHNSYYQRKNTGINSHTQIIHSLNLHANNQEEFEYAIRKFEENPDLIKWLDY